MFETGVQAVMDEVDGLRHRVDDHWQIPREEAELLAQLVRLGGCRSICEVGVSYGYSTLHLAAATQPLGGRVHGFELSAKKVAAATDHLSRAGLDGVVTIHPGDARETLAAFEPESPYDFAFIDATKAQSGAYLDALLPKLADRAVLITDNTVSHAEELSDFVRRLRGLDGATSCGVRVGNGFELTVLQR